MDLSLGKGLATMNHESSLRPLVPALVLLVSSLAVAQLQSLSSANHTGTVNLVSSVVRATVGAQWIDVEEDAELQAIPASGDASQAFQVVGKFTLPPSALVTGCMLWRGDTVLTGRLRANYVAGQSYDSVVKNDTGKFSSDPLVLEKVGANQYSLRAYPFAPRGSRRLRIRYLVPVLARNGDVRVLPVFSQNNGQKPSNWTLLLRGGISPVTIVRDDKRTVVTSPSSQRQTFPGSGTVSLNWGANPVAGAPRAIFNRVTAGTWAGDYALYTGRIPDSLARKVALRSETVILWRWIHPETFNGGTHGARAIDQARRLENLVDFVAGQGNKVALVVDQGLDEVVKSYPLADSGSAGLRGIKTWLSGIDQSYLDWRFPATPEGAANGAILDLSRNRTRFQHDVDSVGKLFSDDPGVIRHLLVVTVGPVPSGGELLEPADVSGLPADVSVSTSQFFGDEFRWDAASGTYATAGFEPAAWPGVDLNELQAVREGGTNLVLSNGVWIPRSRRAANGTLSIEGPRGDVATLLNLEKGADGAWLASIGVHEPTLGKTLKWIVNDDDGNVLAAWQTTPAWTEFVDDSIVPRLWANMEWRTSQMPGFDLPSISLATTFGFIDERYSLLSMAGDTLRRAVAPAFSDSGLPFLKPSEIFPSTAFKNGPPPATGIQVRPATSKLHLVVVWSAMRRSLRIEFARESPQVLEVLDVAGRVLQRWTAQELAGKSHIDWSPGDRSTLRGGLVLVRMVTATGVRSMPLALP